VINFWDVDGYLVFDICEIPKDQVPPDWIHKSIEMHAFNQTIGPALLEGHTSGAVLFNSSKTIFQWALKDTALNVISSTKMVAWMKITLPPTEPPHTALTE
jgi:hypothetical protein